MEKDKLFRQSVQSIERQVLSTDLRGYKGEFLSPIYWRRISL